MKINVDLYRKCHGRGPGGHRQVWSFYANNKRVDDIIRIEGNLEFSAARRKAIEIAKRLTDVTELAVVP
jgi:hypothetical protein